MYGNMKKCNGKKTNFLYFHLKYTSFLWALFCIFLSVIFFLSLSKEFNYDEIELIHTSWKILQGERIYIDFFQHHHPLLYYLIIPVIAIFGENTTVLISARIIIFLLLVSIFAITYLLATKIFDKSVSVISLVFLSTALIFIERAVEIRPDVPQTLFNLAALLFLIIYLENKNQRYLIFCSLASGIAFLFLQKALFVSLLLFLILLFNVYKKNIHFNAVLVYLFINFLSFLPYFIYLVYSNSLNHYIIFNWILNIKLLDRSYPFETLIDSFKVNTLIWVFYFLGLLYFLKTSSQKQFGFISLCLLVFIVFTRKSYQQYFMPLVPLIAIIASHAIGSMFRANRKLVTIVLTLSLLIPSYNFCSWFIQRSNDLQLQKINYVLSLTTPQDFVYDGKVSFNLFRKDINFFWYSLDPGDGLSTYKSIFRYDYNIYQAIDRYKPRIITNHAIENMKDNRIFRYYRQSGEYNDLFIRTDHEWFSPDSCNTPLINSPRTTNIDLTERCIHFPA